MNRKTGEDIESMFQTEEDCDNLKRLLSAMEEFNASNDPIHRQRLEEEIYQLKKTLIKLITGMDAFKTINYIVAGDKNADKAEFVVCCRADTDPMRLEGSIEVECCHCKVAVVLSPDSPKAPPKICMDCAIAEGKRRNEHNDEDSLGA